jgi:hypothetical protein
MTAAYPARVIAVEPDFAIVEAAGNRRHALTELIEELHPGDRVLMAGDHIIRRIGPQGAEMLAHQYRESTGVDMDDDLEDERHHYPTEDPEVARPRLHHLAAR